MISKLKTKGNSALNKGLTFSQMVETNAAITEHICIDASDRTYALYVTLYSSFDFVKLTESINSFFRRDI